MPSADLTKLIEDAVRERFVIRVTYRALDQTEMVSLIEPLAIRFNTAGHRVLWCFNRDAGHIEGLLWDRIENAATTGDVFEPRPWVDSSIEMHGMLPGGTGNIVNPDGTRTSIDEASLHAGKAATWVSPYSRMVAKTVLPPMPPAPIWLEGASSPFGFPVLDVRSITSTSTSMSGNPAIVERFQATRAATGQDVDGMHPEPTVVVPCDISYPGLAGVPNGRVFVASAMEDKWDVFLTPGSIRMLRSWTGEVVFVAHVSPFGLGGPLIEIHHLEYSAESEMSPAEALMDFDFVMKAYVFGDVLPLRCPASLHKKSLQEMAVASFSRHGRRAGFLTFVDIHPGYGGPAPNEAVDNPDPPKQIADEPSARKEITVARDGNSGRSARESWYEPLTWVLAVLDGEGETDWALGNYRPVRQNPVRTIEARLLREISRAITADELGAWEAEANGDRWAGALAWALGVLTSGDSQAILTAASRAVSNRLGPAPDWAPNR